MLGLITRSKFMCTVQLLLLTCVIVLAITSIRYTKSIHFLTNNYMENTDSTLTRIDLRVRKPEPEVLVKSMTGKTQMMPESIKENHTEVFQQDKDTTERKTEESPLKHPKDQNPSSQRIKNQETKTAGKSSETLLVLFSTWSLKKGKEHVRRSILGSWRHWYPQIVPALLTESAEAKREAEGYDWDALNVGETACNDSYMPTLRGMFNDIIARYNNTTSIFGFANGDLLFDDGLRNTMEAFVKSEASVIKSRPVMLLGKRINVKVPENTTMVNLTNVKRLAGQGHYPGEGSSDLFFTNHLFPWNRVPEMVIGRIGFGMWIVAFARANNITLYDFTKTVTAIHLTTKDGIYESHKSSNSFCNHLLFRKKHLLPKSFDCGWINCSDRRSEFSGDGSVLFRKVSNTSLWTRCHACD